MSAVSGLGLWHVRRHIAVCFGKKWIMKIWVPDVRIWDGVAMAWVSEGGEEN